MKTQFKLIKWAARLVLLSTFTTFYVAQLSTVHAQGTAFTYQGRLNDGTNFAHGRYDLRFAIYDAATAGTRQGGLLTNSATVVSNGLFTVTLDFGNQFPGANRWLQISVRTNGTGAFTTLSPRQPLMPMPYAITAGNVSGTVGVGNLPANVALLDANQTFTGLNTFTFSNLITGDLLIEEGGVYHHLELSGGNSIGFLWGDYTTMGDGIHLGYNFYSTPGNFHIPNPGGGTSRLTLGYGIIQLATSSFPDGIPNVWVTLDGVGRLGIGRVPTANLLEVEGNASKTTAGSWLANSDARIKTDVATVTNALETLDRIRLVRFRYTQDYRAGHSAIDDHSYLNVVAQEFAQVFPDYVKDSGEKLPDGSGILQADTYPLTIYSAAAVQELKRKVEFENTELRDELKQKETEITELKGRLDALEKIILNQKSD